MVNKRKKYGYYFSVFPFFNLTWQMEVVNWYDWPYFYFLLFVCELGEKNEKYLYFTILYIIKWENGNIKEAIYTDPYYSW